MSLKCNNCQKIIEVSLETPIHFCPYCGEKIIFEQSSSSENEINFSKSICPICSTEIETIDEKVICPDCKMVYHKDCWEENNGCATYGCQSTGCLKPPPVKIEIPQTNQGNITCPYCHTNLPYGCEICWACNKKISVQNVTNDPVIASPWLRLGARHVDLFIELLLSIIIMTCSIEIFTRFFSTIFEDSSDIIYLLIVLSIIIITLLIMLILDIIIYMLLGNSLGKWLFGIRVVHLSGNCLNYKEYIKRNYNVFLEGLILLIPIANLLNLITQYRYIKKHCNSKYDEKLNYMVIIYESKWWKKIIGIVLTIMSIICFYSYTIIIPISIIIVLFSIIIEL